MLVVTPAFCKTKDIPDADAHRKGPQLETYQFTSESGAIYEYAVENISDLDDDDELAQEVGSLILQEDRREVQKWQNRCGWELFDHPPKSYDARVLLNIELVSASNFSSAGNLYIQYEVLLPSEGWTMDPAVPIALQILRGSTQTSKTSENTAHFSFPIELNLFTTRYSNPMIKRPQLSLQVFSRDQWERVFVQGYVSIDLPVESGYHERIASTWKPMGSISSQMQNFFVGGSNQLLDPCEVTTSFKSKFGFKTESSGSIRLRMNVMEQKHAPTTLSKKTKQRDVNDILSRLGRVK